MVWNAHVHVRCHDHVVPEGRLVSVAVKARWRRSCTLRKHHKTICTKSTTGTVAPSRPPSIKLAEKLMADEELMGYVDSILVKALDLEHHPENADKYAVVLSCHVESTDTRLAAERIRYFMNGMEPPPLPAKMPKLFQINKKYSLLASDSVPAEFNEATERQRAILHRQGLLKPGSKEYLIRAMFVTPDSEWAVCYCHRVVNQPMIDEVAEMKKPEDFVDDDESIAGGPIGTHDLIK